MAMNKKGFMFTLVTIFLISIFVFILYSRSSNVMMEQEKGSAERTEAIVVNLFTKNLADDYMTSITKVAGANAIRAMLDYINQTKTPLTDPEGFFRETLVNGTVLGGYSRIATSTDSVALQFDMLNGSTSTHYVSSENGAISFGDSVVVVQKIESTEYVGDIQYITLNISSVGTPVGDVYLVVYNDSTNGAVVALDQKTLNIPDGQTQEVRFNVDGLNFLGPDNSYYILIAAPFTAEEDSYALHTSSDAQFTEQDLDQWRIDGTDVILPVPLDFYLSKPIIGQGFLRELMNSFESLGKEKLNIDTTINLTSLNITNGPWDIEMNATYSISTKKTTVSFSDIYSEGIGNINIIGMYDPLSILRSDILTEQRQFLRIYSQNITETFDEEDMVHHLEDQTFVFNEQAPSFLGRFAGTDAVASTCCGIQTVYLPGYLTTPNTETSYVDYKYGFVECTETNPLYYISGAADDLGHYSESESRPYLEYEDVEFYHLDTITGVTVAQASCPTTST